MMTLRRNEKKTNKQTHKKAKAPHQSVKKLKSLLHQTHKGNEFHFRGKMDCLGKGGSHTASLLQSSKNKNLTPPMQNKGGIHLSYKPYHILFVVTQIA